MPLLCPYGCHYYRDFLSIYAVRMCEDILMQFVESEDVFQSSSRSLLRGDETCVVHRLALSAASLPAWCHWLKSGSCKQTSSWGEAWIADIIKLGDLKLSQAMEVDSTANTSQFRVWSMYLY